MKPTALLTSVVLAVSLLVAPVLKAPALASSTGAHASVAHGHAQRVAPTCSTRTFKRRIKFERKVKLTITHTARACVEPQGCTFPHLASYNLHVVAKVTKARGVKTKMPWKVDERLSGGKTFTECTDSDIKLLATSDTLFGYFWFKRGRKKYRATPQLRVSVSGDTRPAVKFYPEYGFRFQKF